jgi:hypothetical protein
MTDVVAPGLELKILRGGRTARSFKPWLVVTDTFALFSFRGSSSTGIAWRAANRWPDLYETGDALRRTGLG